MTLNNPSRLILTAIVSIGVTVFMLDSQGYIRHSSNQDSLYIAEFSLLANKPGLQQTVSAKPADFLARCEQGYLVMDAAENRSDLSGLLVDKSKRPITCKF